MTRLNGHSTVFVCMACAVVFCLFVFYFLFCYQPDLMAYTQHVLSGGRTHYDRHIGAILITLALVLVSWGVWKVTQLTKEAHALVYFPSLLLLAVLTSAEPISSEALAFPSWLWATPVLLAVYVVVITAIVQYRRDNSPRFYALSPMRTAWINLLLLSAMMLATGLLSNHDEVVHYRLKAEGLMLEGRYEEALKVGRQSAKTDPSLTMLRIHALSVTRQLPERLFTYPIRFSNSSTTTLLLPSSVIARETRRNKKQRQLCQALLDKDIDRFAVLVQQSQMLAADTVAVPRHYAEALLLYAHLRSKPVVLYKNDVLEADYRDFVKMERETHNQRERQNKLHDNFGNTYWMYYSY